MITKPHNEKHQAQNDTGEAVTESAAPRVPSIPRTVWVLGFVSLLMDVSSEMIHAVLPIRRAEEAHAILQRNENIGKVVLEID